MFPLLDASQRTEIVLAFLTVLNTGLLCFQTWLTQRNHSHIKTLSKEMNGLHDEAVKLAEESGFQKGLHSTGSQSMEA